MQSILKNALAAAAMIVATQTTAQITFYEGDAFRGASFRADRMVDNFAPTGFNDRAASAIVERGRWEVCTDAGFRGRCAVFSARETTRRWRRRPRLHGFVGASGWQRAIRERGAAPAPVYAAWPRWRPRQATTIAVVPTSTCSRFPCTTFVRWLARPSSAAGSSANRSSSRRGCAQRRRCDRRRDPGRRSRPPGRRWTRAGCRNRRWRGGRSCDRRQRRAESGRCVQRRTCSAAPWFPARRGPTTGTSPTTSTASSITCR